jgi:hypothetical protein
MSNKVPLTNKDQKQDMQKKIRRNGNTDKSGTRDKIWKDKDRLEKDMYRRNKRKPSRDGTTKDCYDFLVWNDDN